MIDKQNFYHGAAIVEVLEHIGCDKIKKVDAGFLVNENIFVFIKYTTKHRSPWRFTFTEDDLKRLDHYSKKSTHIFVTFVCGGDGICVATFEEFNTLTENTPGWIAVNRKFHEQYGISGSKGELKNKISFRRWPEIIFNHN